MLSNQYYGTGGLINIFYNSYVQPLVDKHHQTFNVIYPGTHIPLKTSNLEYFKAVAAVQTLLYQGDSTLHLEINFSPVYKNETWTFSSNQLTMEMNKEMIVGWPMGISQDGVTIKEGKKQLVNLKAHGVSGAGLNQGNMQTTNWLSLIIHLQLMGKQIVI